MNPCASVFLQIQTNLWRSSKHTSSCFDVRQTYEVYKKSYSHLKWHFTIPVIFSNITGRCHPDLACELCLPPYLAIYGSVRKGRVRSVNTESRILRTLFHKGRANYWRIVQGSGINQHQKPCLDYIPWNEDSERLKCNDRIQIDRNAMFPVFPGTIWWPPRDLCSKSVQTSRRTLAGKPRRWMCVKFSLWFLGESSMYSRQGAECQIVRVSEDSQTRTYISAIGSYQICNTTRNRLL